MKDYNWRNHTVTNRIPAEMMFARPVKNELSFLNPNYNLANNNRGHQKYSVNEPVWFRQKKVGKWIPAVIQKSIGSKLYLVACGNDGTKKVHEDQVRPQLNRESTRDRAQPNRLKYG